MRNPQGIVKFVLAGLLVFVPLVALATVYMQVDKNGNTSYSDSPSPGAKAIDVPVSSVSAAPPKSTETKTDQKTEITPDAEVHVPYTAFYISSPYDQETFQNERDIIIRLRVVPKLQMGDKIQLFLDGKPYGAAAESSSPQLSQVDRGSHQVFATLLDKNNQILKQTNSVTIFIHYANIPNALPTGNGG